MSDSFVTLWTVARQAPLSMGFSRQEYGVGCHFLLQGTFLTQGLNLCLLRWRADPLLPGDQGSTVHVALLTHAAGKAPSLITEEGSQKWVLVKENLAFICEVF